MVDYGRSIAAGDSTTLSISMVPNQKALYSQVVYESISRMSVETLSFSPRFYSLRSKTILEAVQFGDADIGIVYKKPEDLSADLVCEWLFDHPFIVWVHKDNPVTKLSAPQISDLKNCKLVQSTNPLFSAWFDGSVAILRENGVEVKTHLKDIDDTAHFLFDLRPDEIVFSSDMGDNEQTFNPSLVCLRFGNPQLRSSTYLLYRKQNRKSIVTKFVDICHTVANEVMASTPSTDTENNLLLG